MGCPLGSQGWLPSNPAGSRCPFAIWRQRAWFSAYASRGRVFVALRRKCSSDAKTAPQGAVGVKVVGVVTDSDQLWCWSGGKPRRSHGESLERSGENSPLAALEAARAALVWKLGPL